MQDPLASGDTGRVQKARVAAVAGVLAAGAEQELGQYLHDQHQPVATGVDCSLELPQDVVEDGVRRHRQLSQDVEFLVLLFGDRHEVAAGGQSTETRVIKAPKDNRKVLIALVQDGGKVRLSMDPMVMLHPLATRNSRFYTTLDTLDIGDKKLLTISEVKYLKKWRLLSTVFHL